MDTDAMSRRTLIINNTAALVLGVQVMILLHEMAHWFTGAALGQRSVMYQFGVDQSGGPGATTAAIALAGPVFSLVLGLVLRQLNPIRAVVGPLRLLWMWLAYTSLQEGVTYFVITPFGAGDTALALEALDLPQWLGFPVMAVGIAGMIWVARLFARDLARLAGANVNQLRAIAMWPWIIATVINMVLALVQLNLAPVTLGTGSVIAILALGMAIGVFAPMAIPFAARRTDEVVVAQRLPAIPWATVAGIVAMVLVGVAMRNGIALGG